MEAKVDIRKLQILNDRISQTLEALQQVRWSVHGLQTTAVNPQTAMPLQGTTQGTPAFPYAAIPAQTFTAQGAYPNPFGLPYGGAQPAPTWAAPFSAPVAYPHVNPSVAVQAMQAVPAISWTQAYAPFALESDRLSVETRATDPALLARTFPQAFAGVASY